MISSYVTAQIIGFLGYLILTCAPTFKKRNHIIKTDIVACLLLSTQWLILEQPSLLILNILNISLSLCALEIGRNKNFKKAILLFYPVGLLILISVSSGTIIDALCMIGFIGLVASKTSENITKFRIFATCACLTFLISGTLALSIPALIFNSLRVSVHIHALFGLLHIRPISFIRNHLRA